MAGETGRDRGVAISDYLIEEGAQICREVFNALLPRGYKLSDEKLPIEVCELGKSDHIAPVLNLELMRLPSDVVRGYI